MLAFFRKSYQMLANNRSTRPVTLVREPERWAEEDIENATR